MSNASLAGRFYRFVIPNIVGMMGISAYFLADTYFIAVGIGPLGLAALNLVLPVFSLIGAIGNMIAVGSATRFRILAASYHKDANQYFGNALFFTFLCSLPFVLVALFAAAPLVTLLGADNETFELATTYTRIFMLFAPFFMCNKVCDAFVRNDGAPKTAMTAVLVSSLFNIVMDYILIFPLGLGIAGAAIATAFSPVIAVSINLTHILSRRSTLQLRGVRISIWRFFHACMLGVAALVGDLSIGITTLVFNFLILGLVGNMGLAAYGIIANLAYVAVALFNGLAQGAQPLFSQFYGEKNWPSLKRVLRLAFASGLVIALVLIGIVHYFAVPLVAVFNSTNNLQMAALAREGLALYFPGYLIATLNITVTCYLAATAAAKWSTATSLLRGAGATIPCAFILARLFGMAGVWCTFAAAEGITLLFVAYALWRVNSVYRAWPQP